MARAAPAQYLWIHRRFKRRPQGMPDPYRWRLNRRVEADPSPRQQAPAYSAASSSATPPQNVE